MKNYFEKQFELRYFEMNKLGEATATAMLTLLEETAADHCCHIHHSLFDLQNQNIGWVLVSGVMQLDYYPKYKEKITIRTWLSSYSTVKGFRENIIYNQQNQIIGRAKGLWVFYDIEKRKPIRILDEIKEKWGFENEISINENISQKITPVNSTNPSKKFKVNMFDVDSNNHVNNIRYLQWLMESIPIDFTDKYYLHSINGRFIKDAQFDDVIMSFTQKEAAENTYTHTIRNRADNKVCANAQTIWRKRE